MFQGLDHLAIVVPDTEESLHLWRDTFGFPVIFQETVNSGTTLLTHLDLGNTQLQLVQPLTDEHPLQEWLRVHGTGLHHFCLHVENIDQAWEESRRRGIPAGESAPHQGTQGKRALFLAAAATAGIQVELTGA